MEVVLAEVQTKHDILIIATVQSSNGMSLNLLTQHNSSEDEEMNEGGIEIVDEDNESQSGQKKGDIKVMRPPLPVPSSTELSKPPVRITPLVSYARGDESGSDSDDSEREEEFDLNVLYLRKAEMQEKLANITPNEGLSPASLVEEPELVAEESNDSRLSSTNLVGQVKLPQEPEGRCSRKLQEKIARMLDKKKLGKLSLNEHVQRKKDFRNPSIYEKLVSYCSIDEYGTNYPRNLFNPSSWGVESYYDALAKAQKEAHEKKEKEKHKKGQVEFIKATKKITVGGSGTQSGDDKKKPSKWDSKPTDGVKHSLPVTSDVPIKKLKPNT